MRKLVKDDPGVIKIRMGRKLTHSMYSVPESAAHRIHTRLLNAAHIRSPEFVPGFGLSERRHLRISKGYGAGTRLE